jgi:hypothetical protein
MAVLNPMVLNKIDSMDLSKERKELMQATLFSGMGRISTSTFWMKLDQKNTLFTRYMGWNEWSA